MNKKKYKTVLVFGALGFLGKHVSRVLANSGCQLVITDLNKSKLDSFAKEIQKKSDISIMAEDCDVTSEQSLRALLTNVKNQYGNVDSIINCSTYSSRDSMKISAPFEEYSLIEWKKMLSVNLDGAFLISKVFGSAMKESGRGGNIVFMSSIYGFLGTDQSIYERVNKSEFRSNNPASYSASKGGVITLAKYLATYWAEDNIRVNVLSLGGIYNSQKHEFKEDYSKRVPMKRMGELPELDSAIIFLLLGDSTYLNGHNLVIDGGLSAW